MKTKILLAVFAALFLVQLGVGLSYVYDNKLTLSEGIPIKFKCRPIDPYDIFRGRYVQLNLDNLCMPYTTKLNGVEEQIQNKKTDNVYIYPTVFADVQITTDENGFAKVEKYAESKELSGLGVLNLRAIKYVRANAEKDIPQPIIEFEVPINRIFMNEKDAPVVEKELIRIRLNSDERVETYVLAKLRNSKLVIEELYLDGKPYKEYLRELTVDPNADVHGADAEAESAENGDTQN